MNTIIKRISHLFCGAIVLACSQVAMADNHGVQLGVLKCNVVPGSRVNLIIRSTADVECQFDNAGTVEKYKGETGIGLGLDLSFKTDEKMHFAVFAASNDVSANSHALAGKYVGAELNAAAGVGLGAKALVGGSNDSFSLQPLALETSTGLGASGGLSFLYIEAAK
ncbi:MAG: DUF992 domain-containing protein [Proteobacteria bacterium]|nr:DUF992 domain-containing protein [Pseudomonadota bacterium]NOG59720.1 DUF992 domain-containing protein [Pseudomonadota bacterium]